MEDVPESPQGPSAQPEELDREEDSPYYRVKKSPVSPSASYQIVGTERGLPAWSKLPSLQRSTTRMILRVNDQIVVYWLDEQDKSQEATALILEIRVLDPKQIKAVQEKEEKTLLLVAWFRDRANPGIDGPATPNQILSSHLDLISTDAVKKVLKTEDRVEIKEVVMVNSLTIFDADKVTWLRREETENKSPEKGTKRKASGPPQGFNFRRDTRGPQGCSPAPSSEDSDTIVILSSTNSNQGHVGPTSSQPANAGSAAGTAGSASGT